MTDALDEHRPPGSIRPLVRGLHHLAIAVADIEDSRGLYEKVLGLEPRGMGMVPEEQVRTLVFDAGGLRIELVEPVGEDSPIAGFLARRGGGLHHVAWRVDDIDEAYRRCVELGLPVIGDGPGPGALGTRVFFLHPRGSGRVLHELVEDPGAERDGGEA